MYIESIDWKKVYKQNKTLVKSLSAMVTLFALVGGISGCSKGVDNSTEESPSPAPSASKSYEAKKNSPEVKKTLPEKIDRSTFKGNETIEMVSLPYTRVPQGSQWGNQRWAQNPIFAQRVYSPGNQGGNIVVPQINLNKKEVNSVYQNALNTYNNLKDRLAEAKKANQQAKDSYDKAVTSEKVAKEALKKAQDELVEAKNKLDEAQTALDSAKSKLVDAKRDYNQKVAEFKKGNEAVLQKLDVAKKTLEEAKSKLAAETKKFEEASKAYNDKHDQLTSKEQSLQKTVKDAQAKLNEAKTTLDVAKSNLETVTKDSENVKSQINALDEFVEGNVFDETKLSTEQKIKVIEAIAAKQINDFRMQYGLPALPISIKMSDSAREWSRHMVQVDKMYHDSAQGVSNQINKYDSSGTYDWTGENVAWGVVLKNQKVEYVAKQFVESWINSEGHRKNFLNANATAMALGIAASGPSDFCRWRMNNECISKVESNRFYLTWRGISGKRVWGGDLDLGSKFIEDRHMPGDYTKEYDGTVNFDKEWSDLHQNYGNNKIAFTGKSIQHSGDKVLPSKEDLGFKDKIKNPERVALEKKLAGLETKKSELEGTIAESEKVVTESNGAIETASKGLTEVKTELGDLEKNKPTDTEVTKATEEVKVAQDNLTTVEKEVGELGYPSDATVKEAEARVTEAQNNFNAADKKVEETQGVITSETQAIADSQKAQETSTDKIAETQNQIDELQKELEVAETNLEAAK